MRRLVGLATALLLLGCTIACAADPVGHYDITGTNPGTGTAYSGDVTVTKTGDTYKVIWTVGGTKYTGTGVGNDEFLTVSYKSGDDTGLALFGHDGDNWKGIWTYAGGTELGSEAWTRD